MEADYNEEVSGTFTTKKRNSTNATNNTLRRQNENQTYAAGDSWHVTSAIAEPSATTSASDHILNAEA